MKKYIAIFVLLTAALCACSKEASVTEPEYVEISVRSFIEGIELTSESPLTRTCGSSYDAYGIQINTGDGTKPYYSGLYDDISLCKSIRLIKGERYWINSVYIPNAKKYQSGIGKPGNYPFCPWPSENTRTFSKFEFNKDYYNSVINFEGFSHDLLGAGYNGATRDVDYYIFTIRGYVAEEGKSLDINYLRYNADLTINFVGGAEYDKVKVSTEDTYYCKTISLTNGEGQYTIPNHMIFYLRGEEDIRIIVSTEDGNTIFYDGNVQFKRNTHRVYTLSLDPRSSDTDITVSYEDTSTDSEDMGTL